MRVCALYMEHRPHGVNFIAEKLLWLTCDKKLDPLKMSRLINSPECLRLSYRDARNRSSPQRQGSQEELGSDSSLAAHLWSDTFPAVPWKHVSVWTSM